MAPFESVNFLFPVRIQVLDGERDSGSGTFDLDPILSEFFQVAADFLRQVFEKLFLPLLLCSTEEEKIILVL